jgi:hypothetical protein
MDRPALLHKIKNEIFNFVGQSSRAYNARELVAEFSERYAPVDIKIAALNLVNQRRVTLNEDWTIGRLIPANKQELA